MTGIGTITAREAKQVALDILAKRRVPAGVWKMGARGELSMLIGSRVVKISFRSGQTFYGLQKAIATLDAAIDEQAEWSKNRNQIDLEEAIARSPTVARAEHTA